VGLCVMDANITISLEEFPDLGGTMSREIVGDDMNFLCWCPSSGSTLQHFSFRRRNHNTFRHPFFLPRSPIKNQCNSALAPVPALRFAEFMRPISFLSSLR